ncbi:hypothetical protein CATMIT_01821, partial [Catenibacterium mitsuokai DSM 15897]
EGQHAVEFVEFARALLERDADVQRALGGADVVEDGQAFGEVVAARGLQGRGFAHRIDRGEQLGLHVFGHVHARQSVGLAGPFQRDDGAERAAGGDAVVEDRGHEGFLRLSGPRRSRRVWPL